MEIIKVQKGQMVAHKNEKVKYWYLVQEGTVLQKFEFSEVPLRKNSIIGIGERDISLCDYVADEDVVLAQFLCENTEELKLILTGQERIRNIFLRAAIEQRNALLTLYSDLNNRSRQFHMFVETVYNDYKNLCGKYRIEEQLFPKMEHFNPLIMQHKAEEWEVNNSASVMKYMEEYLHLMEKDENLTVGAIKEAAAQIQRFMRGILEMESYLSYNKGILIGEEQADLFRLYFDLSIAMYEKKYKIDTISEKIQLIAKLAERLNIYNPRMISRKLREFQEYDYAGKTTDGNVVAQKEQDITSEDCLNHILEFAGYDDETAEQITKMIDAYRDLADPQSTENEVRALRKQITTVYYDMYERVFLRVVEDESRLTPVLKMFLNFGFVDTGLTGEEYAKELYDLCAHLDICRSKRIYTIYEWLKCIYKGEKEPSKNEFDLNFEAYLVEQSKNGKLTQAQVKEYYQSPERRVAFEIRNMFASVNKLTYGKISTFCPLLRKDDLLNSLDRMLVTAEKLERALNEIRKIDYSVFYQEVSFSDPEKGINNERIMKEILPDMILMPNAGTRVMMWQETSGRKSSTPGRFMFPVFTAVELDELMLEAVGQYRWEMCRRLEGVHWNDIREKSLTAEYCTYLQFYRKNHDLSADAKEKVKSALTRAKNSYREVFVRDYVNWVKFESKGSFRLNKVVRDILVRYCPFAKEIRNDLRSNPLYQAAITRFETETAKKLQRFGALYNKYMKAGGEIMPELKENLIYYQM